ncbi:MAG TPA: O-methyltransferase [Mycobacteriales bacterium]|jgi:predicted O-methyltransferase YrrM|nr:O-methyltransferase [Mycobacteriales bacterium]
MGSARASWEYAERWVPEDEALRNGRQRADEVGCTPIGPGGGAALRLLAAAAGARSVIEIGTGTGVSGTWLLRGMRPDGVLTSIDVEPEHQRLARATFAEAGFSGSRVRLICGPALEVLPRFTEGAYDLLFIDALKAEYPEYLVEGVRLLRPGGIVAVDNALWHDKVADPEADDADTQAVRSLLETVAEDAGLVSALLPVGDGLLVAVRG